MKAAKNMKVLSLLAALVCGTACAAAVVVACSSDDSNANPGPTVNDSGPGNDIDANSPTGDDDSGSVQDSNTPIVDSNLPDVGNCQSDAAHCNSCYTVAQNPLNGCSPATVNCTPFDNSVVPSGAP